MSETTQHHVEAGASGTHEETVHGSGRPHPRDRNYVMIALILGAITALEIVFYIFEGDLGNAVVIPGLIIMMIVKFFIVAAWFMHLRFDSGLFTRLFVAGLVLAVAIYIGMLLSFQYWGGDGTRVDESREDGTALVVADGHGG